jgi:uncharacterized repeat protein (TIGR03803 family)
VTTNGVLTTLVSFNLTNGSAPRDGLILGDDGNLYGTTATAGPKGFGTVYRLTPDGALTTLVSFNNTNGANPIGGLVFGKDGFLYGTTGLGGTNNFSFGDVFKMTTNGIVTTLYDFKGTDGEEPSFRLIFGNDGRLYGTTSFGGVTENSPSSIGSGSVFAITTNGTYTSLFLFRGTNGSSPAASLTLGPDGNLYGTTAQGGPGGGGTIFRVVLAPRLAGIATLPDRRLVLTATGPSGTALRLRTSPDLTRPIQSWTVLSNSVFDVNGTFTYTDSPPSAVRGFYRVSTP